MVFMGAHSSRCRWKIPLAKTPKQTTLKNTVRQLPTAYDELQTAQQTTRESLRNDGHSPRLLEFGNRTCLKYPGNVNDYDSFPN
jgi:hypothetical protein